MRLLEKDEEILLEDIITYNNVKKKCDLYLTNRRIIIKPQSLFSRSLLVFLDEIVIYRNKIKLEQDKNKVYMQNVNGNLLLKFDNEKDAKKFVDTTYDALGIKRKKIDAKAVIAGVTAIGAAAVAAKNPAVGKTIKNAVPIAKDIAEEVAPTVAKKLIEKI